MVSHATKGLRNRKNNTGDTQQPSEKMHLLPCLTDGVLVLRYQEEPLRQLKLTINYLNPSAAVLLHLHGIPTPGQDLSRWLPDTHPVFRQIVSALLTSKTTVHHSVTIPDRYHHLHLAITKLSQQEALIKLSEITDHHQVVQECLREKYALFKTIFDAMPYGILLLDLQGKVIECNAAASSFINRSLEGIRGRSLDDLHIPIQGMPDAAISINLILASLGIQETLSLHAVLPQSRDAGIRRQANLTVARMDVDQKTAAFSVIIKPA